MFHSIFMSYSVCISVLFGGGGGVYIYKVPAIVSLHTADVILIPTIGGIASNYSGITH